jgi:hypothetical protein
MQPNVTDTVLDGQLGALPPSMGVPFVVIGPATAGPLNTPVAYSRKQSFPENYGYGPGVELSANSVDATRVPCIFVRANASVAGSAGEAVAAADGTCGTISYGGVAPGNAKAGNFASSFDGTHHKPTMARTVRIFFPVGGTIGTTGIVFQVSTDGGVTYDTAVALLTGTNITIGALGDVTVVVGSNGQTVGDHDYLQFVTTAPVLASDGTLDDSGVTGEAQITISTSGGTPNDDYDPAIRIVKGGTGGVAGITYQWTLDYYSSNPTWSAEIALGTALSIAIPGAGGWTYVIGGATKTLNAGDVWSSRTTAPHCNGTDLTNALASITATKRPWSGLILASPIDSTLFGVLENWLAARDAAGDPQRAVTYWRLPNVGESRSAYQTARVAEMGGLSSANGKIVVGGRSCGCVSAVSGREYRRPNIWGIAAKLLTVSAEINAAMIDPPGGAIAGVTIRDANGNVRDHDESYEPGDDDARFFCLRTWDEFEGVFVNRPRTFCLSGSDFVLLPRGRVFDIGRKLNRAFFLRKLSRGVPANKKTGYIDEQVARRWERDAVKVQWEALGGKPMVSDVAVTIWRTDALLMENAVMHVEYRQGPLIYVEQIAITSAMRNPALGG